MSTTTETTVTETETDAATLALAAAAGAATEASRSAEMEARDAISMTADVRRQLQDVRAEMQSLAQMNATAHAEMRAAIQELREAMVEQEQNEPDSESVDAPEGAEMVEAPPSPTPNVESERTPAIASDAPKPARGFLARFLLGPE